MPELKPCPFYGETIKLKIIEDIPSNNTDAFYWILCLNCRASNDSSKIKEAAIYAWNKRVKEREE